MLYRNASVLELADRHVWGACVVRRTGSSPVTRTSLNNDIGKEYVFFALLLYSDYPPKRTQKIIVLFSEDNLGQKIISIYVNRLSERS